MAIGARLGGARLLALFTALALVVVLSLDWFALDPPTMTQVQDGSGVLNLLNTYSTEGFHASGWAGLGRLPVVLLLVGAAGVVAGLRLPALVVAFAALVLLVVDLPLAGDDLIAMRWPPWRRVRAGDRLARLRGVDLAASRGAGGAASHLNSRTVIDREQVLHVAKLARLELSDEEVGRMATELSSVLGHIETISKLSLDDVAPTSHVVEVANALRADV